MDKREIQQNKDNDKRRRKIETALVDPRSLYKIRTSIQKGKDKIERLGGEIENEVERQTINEFEQLKNAHGIYQKKLQEVLHQPHVVKAQEEIEEEISQLQDLAYQVEKGVNQYICQIKNNSTLSDKEKSEMIKNTLEAARNALLSDNEKRARAQMLELVNNLAKGNTLNSGVITMI